MRDAEATAREGITVPAFAGFMLFFFLLAQVADDVRRDIRNLGLGFVIPFLLAATFVGLTLVRIFWRVFPGLAPIISNSQPRILPSTIGLATFTVAAIAWIRSAAFPDYFDPFKLVLTALWAGAILGSIYSVTGGAGILVSILHASLAITGAYLTFILIARLGAEPDETPEELLQLTLSMASIGIPYTFIVALYDSYRRTLQDG